MIKIDLNNILTNLIINKSQDVFLPKDSKSL